MFKFNLFTKIISSQVETDNIKPVTLLILDGFGIAPPSQGNAITQAKTPNYNKLLKTFPHGQLIASGESVGLPASEEGNSEVGHLTIGAGKVVLQSLIHIKRAIEDGTFMENSAFNRAIEHVSLNNSKLHIMGLVSSGEVHSSKEHLNALIDLCIQRGVARTCLHLFTDGRDAPPTEGKDIIAEIVSKIQPLPSIKIATIMGRYFAMDRDKRWDRTQRAYEAMVLGKGTKEFFPIEAVENAYKKGQTDEFIEPIVICNTEGNAVATIDDNDAIIFFNFRIDRPRQLTMAFTMPDFEELKGLEMEYDPYHTENKPRITKNIMSGPTFKREKWPKNTFFVSMTEYQKNIPVSAVAFPPEIVANSLSKILSEQGYKQLHIAESEKERMVTYYFDGLRETQLPGEKVIIVLSPKVATYDRKPEMSTPEIVRQFKKSLKKGYQFIVINFACPDMVGHSGNLAASIKAVEAVDKGMGEIVDSVLSLGGSVIITADHGNVEELTRFSTSSFFYTSEEGSLDTSHSNNPVPLIIASPELQGNSKNLPQGTLSDVAPTILSIMKLPVPEEMTGRNLLV